MSRQLSLADSFAEVKRKRKTEVVDLFCGCGGFSTGAARVPGVRVVMAVDNRDLYGRRVLEVHRSNHPGTKHYAMRLGPKIEKKLVRRIKRALSPGTHLHLHGSPPCQDWSTLRTLGTDQGRRELTTWFVSFSKRLPRYFPGRRVTVSMENVVAAQHSPMISDDHNKTIISAGRHGASTSRRRLFWAYGWSIHDLAKFERPGRSILETLPWVAAEKWTGFMSNQKFSDYKVYPLDGKMITILTSTTGHFVVKDGDGNTVKKRGLTPKETAILQGFPQDYFDKLAGLKRCFSIKCVGNSVCPDIGDSIMRGVRCSV